MKSLSIAAKYSHEHVLLFWDLGEKKNLRLASCCAFCFHFFFLFFRKLA